jgi:hypothetical protein
MEFKPETNEEERNRIIALLPLSKQFNLRQLLSNADGLSKDQAIEMLKESLVHTAYKDHTFLTMLKHPVI